MKLVFTTAGTDLDAGLDPSFGRAPRFLLLDLDSQCFEVIDNRQNIEATQGAGIQAAQTIVRAGAQALITGHCGPKAFRVLSAAGVKVFNANVSTIAEALARYRTGALTEAQAANIEGHWV